MPIQSLFNSQGREVAYDDGTQVHVTDEGMINDLTTHGMVADRLHFPKLNGRTISVSQRPKGGLLTLTEKQSAIFRKSYKGEKLQTCKWVPKNEESPSQGSDNPPNTHTVQILYKNSLGKPAFTFNPDRTVTIHSACLEKVYRENGLQDEDTGGYAFLGDENFAAVLEKHAKESKQFYKA